MLLLTFFVLEIKIKAEMQWQNKERKEGRKVGKKGGREEERDLIKIELFLL